MSASISSEPPRRGSAAATQKRDSSGRFVAVDRKRQPTRSKTRSGRTGPTYLAVKSKLELTRLAVRDLRKLEAMRAETLGVAPPNPVRIVPQRMTEILKLKNATVTHRRRVLAEILEDCAFERISDPSPSFLASEMQERLGTTFRVEQLYRPALIGIWRKEADYFGKQAIDRERGAAGFHRMSRRRLVASILRMREEAAELEASRRIILLDAVNCEGWSLSEIMSAGSGDKS